MPALLEDAVRCALPGAQDHGNNVVTFALYAPGKQSVHLIGSFNDWNAQRDALEQHGEGYWVIAKELADGPHEYQFIIDDEIVICDPYAQEIEPIKEQDQPHAVVRVGRPIYEWKYGDWQRPNLRDLIIYEMHVGDFSPEGTFRGVINRLDYLRDLGINALELMPPYESVPRAYWGYEPNFFLAVRKSYGTAHDLLRLIDEAHGRGIAIILDMVLNHTGHYHPFMKMYPWEQSPWYGEPIGETNQFGLPTLDFTKPATNGFVRDVQAYWLRVFHVDGFRYDYLAGLGANEEGQGLPYLMRTAREIQPEAYLIGECIPEAPDLTNNSGLNAVWHTRSRLALECLLRERDEVPYKHTEFEGTVRTLDPRTQDYCEPSFMVNYAECHDDVRMIRALCNDVGLSREVAYRKSALAATILMTIPGEPMLYHGQEWGEAAARKQASNKIDWRLLDSPEGRCLHQHYSDACKLRRERTSLRSNQFEFTRIDAEHRTAVYQRVLGEADQVVVAVNFSPEKQRVSVQFPQSGHWRERFTRELMNVNGLLEVELDGYWAKVFTSGVS